MATTGSVAYWERMRDSAAANIEKVSEMDMPETEHEVKACVAHVMRHGTCRDKAEVLVEAMEFMTACHELKAHAMPM